MDYLDRLPPPLLFIFQLFFFFFFFLQDDNSRISNLKDYYGLFSLVVIIIFEYDCLPETSKVMLFFKKSCVEFSFLMIMFNFS